MNNLFLFLFALFAISNLILSKSYAQSSALPSQAAVFVINQVTNSGVINQVTNAVQNANLPTTVDGVTRVVVPILQENGSYVNQTVIYSIVNGVQQIAIENENGIQIINDAANYLIQLTPEQISVSENVTCNISNETCTIKPFMMLIGDRVLTADEFTVGYKEGEDLIISEGQAKNLKLTGPNSQTSAGDSVVNVSFGKDGIDPVNPVTSVDALLNLPQNFSDQQYFRLELGTSALTHSVLDPNTGEMKEQWGVKDGGVTTSLTIDNKDNLNIHFNGQTDGGFFYDSDPFSDRSVTVDTTAPISTDLVIVDQPEGTMTTLSIAMADKNKDGTPATVSIVDSRSTERTDRIDASGGAFLNLSSTAAWNDGNPSYKDQPVAFELGADDVTVRNEFSGGQVNTTNVQGLRVAGNITPDSDNKEIVAVADNVSHTQIGPDGKPVLQAGAEGNIAAYVYEDDSTRILEGMANRAYYNNGGTVVDLSGGVAVRVTDYKEQGEGSTFNGRPVERDAVILGHQATLNYDGSSATANDGFAIRQITYADNGSKLTLIEGRDGRITDQQYGVEMSEDFRVAAYQDENGKLKAAEVTTGAASAEGFNNGSHLQLVNSNTTLDVATDPTTKAETLYIAHRSEGVVFTDGKGEVVAGADKIVGQAVITDDVKYGTGKFDGVTITGKRDEKTGKTPSVSFVSVEAAVYVDESDPNNRTIEGLFGIEGMNATYADYSFDIVAVDEHGNEGRFNVYYLENEDGRKVVIYGEDGKLVNLQAEDAKEGAFYNILFEAAQYIETAEFRSILATKVSGEITATDPSDSRLTQFNLARVEGLERLDGSYRHFIANNGQIRHVDGSDEYRIGFDRATFVETNTIDTKTIVASAENGAFDYVKYTSGNALNGTGAVGQQANITFGNAIYARLEVEGQKPVTVFEAEDINIVAVDYQEMLELNGRIGSVNFFEDANITVIDAKDLQDFRVEDKNNRLTALFNANQVVRVVQRDDNGRETGSYLLINSAMLEATDAKNGINANLRIGVLEYFKDELTGKNLFLDVDVSGKVAITNSNIPFKVEGEFSVDATNVTDYRESYVSDDGATVTEFFAIKTFNDEGRIDNVSLSAGPEFLSNAIQFKAKGGPSGGKELSFTFHQDKANGTYYIKAEFKEGESVKMKLFPFTLESKKIGDDAIADLLISSKGQNYLNHLQIITSVVDTHEITSWLEISNNGMIIASTPALGGVGIEIMYQNTDVFHVPGDPSQNINGAAPTIGAGIYVDGKDGAQTSFGLMLTGDSEFDYQTNGTFKVFGFDMGESGRIPATVNLYAKREFANGDALMGGLSFDLTSMTVDKNFLDNNGSYFDGGGRSPGGVGGSITYRKRLGEQSYLSLSVGANNNFSDPAACITFSTTTDEVGRVIGDGIRAIRRMGFN